MIYIWPVLILNIVVAMSCIATKDKPAHVLIYIAMSILLVLALIYPDAGKGWF